MTKDEYKKLIESKKPHEEKFKNAMMAFFSGGFLALFSEILLFYFTRNLKIDKELASMLICIILIFLASLITSLGYFDNLVKKYKCGLIIPTTGFAHSVSSSALEYRKDGLITGLGANFFKLAGSVILYGITTSVFLCIIKAVLLCLY